MFAQKAVGTATGRGHTSSKETQRKKFFYIFLGFQCSLICSSLVITEIRRLPHQSIEFMCVRKPYSNLLTALSKAKQPKLHSMHILYYRPKGLAYGVENRRRIP